ncbi:MAG: hypothetical protein QM762_25140 [Chryseolinea sp.]
MRYLDFDQLQTNLSLGKAVEQWLGTTDQGEYTTIQWVRIYKERPYGDVYNVCYHDVFDDGGNEFTDIVEFDGVDPDHPFGTAKSFYSYQEALNFAVQTFNCKLERFVNSGSIQSEYIEYLRARKNKS